MPKKYFYCSPLILIFISMSLLMGCASQKSKYQREYSLLWKELIKSEAWNNALSHKNEQQKEQTDLFTSNTDSDVLDEASLLKNSVTLFSERYDHLVARAYYKIISEAERADEQIKKEYAFWNDTALAQKRKNNKTYREQKALINKKYHAHQAMLQGLKSWNIFSENRSGDLDFFKAENEVHTLEMLQKGYSEEAIINTLVYKLADLYHFEEN